MWPLIERYRYWLSAGLGVLFLYLAFGQVQFDRVPAVLGQANLWGLLAGPVIYLGIMGLRSLRWQYLLRHLKEVPVSRTFPVVAIGYMVSNLLPARAGDLARAWLLGNREGMSKTSVLASIVVERLLDGATTVVLLAGLLPVLSLPPWAQRAMLILAVVLVGLGLGALLLAWNPRLVAERLFGLLAFLPPAPRGRLSELFGLFLEGLGALRHGGNLLAAASLSLAIWLGAAAIYYSVMVSLGLSLPPWAAVFVACVVNIGSFIPSAPGYLGAFEISAMSALALLAVPAESAFGVTLVTHAILFLPGTLLGLVCLWRENLSLALLGQEAQRGGSSPASTGQGIVRG